VAAGLLGALAGKILDDYRKEAILKDAKSNFFIWRRRWEELKKLEKVTKKMIKESELIPFGNIAITPPKEKNHPTIVSGNYYKKEILPELNFNEKWKYLIGNPAPNFYMLIHGLPGNGKTTLAVQFSEYFQRNHGKVIYLASEQFGVTKSLQKILKLYNATFDIHTKANLLNSESAAKLIQRYDMVVIDSVNHIKWSHEQIEVLRAKCKNTAFVAIMQSKKDGDFKGEQDFAHNSDIMIKVESMTAKQYKSRFGPPSEVPLIAN
jgi:predicted ATP-dependent serine protease